MTLDGLMVLEGYNDEPKKVILFLVDGKESYEKELGLGHFMHKLSKMKGAMVYEDYVNLSNDHFADLYSDQIQNIVEQEVEDFTTEITGI